MKKIFSVSIILMLGLVLISCGAKAEKAEEVVSEESVETIMENAQEEAVEAGQSLEPSSESIQGIIEEGKEN